MSGHAAPRQDSVGDRDGDASAEPFDVRLCRRLGREGRISEQDILGAVSLAERSGQPIRILLDRLGLLSLGDWAAEAARESGLELRTLDDLPLTIPSDVRLSRDFLQRQKIFPLKIAEGVASFALADPFDAHATSALRMMFGDGLRFAIASDRDIEAAFERAEKAEAAPAEETLPGADLLQDTDLDRLLELANNAPTVRFVDELFADALARRATDIHLEPLADRPRVRFRIDGILIEAPAPSLVLYRGVISRLKILASLDVAERRRAQDGRITIRADNRQVDIRIAIAPTVHGEAATLRFLDARAGLARLDALELPTDAADVLRRSLEQPNGLLLVTGPTGSGKTTTLHAALAELNEVGRKIVTIENPVEILTPGLIQIEVDPGLGWTFAAAMRAILRHDPNVLMVGEIRDEETAEMAMRLALTGHLVLSTVHTNSASEAPGRIANLGIARHLMAATLRMVASQRLVRQLCPACAVPAPEPDRALYFQTVARATELAPHWVPPEAERLLAPAGCGLCDEMGFRGRVAIFEAMDAQTSVAALEPGFRRRHRAMGEHGLERVALGQTTLDELMRVVGPPEAWA